MIKNSIDKKSFFVLMKPRNIIKIILIIFLVLILLGICGLFVWWLFFYKKDTSTITPLNPLNPPLIPIKPWIAPRWGCALGECVKTSNGLYNTQEECEENCKSGGHKINICDLYPNSIECKKKQKIPKIPTPPIIPLKPVVKPIPLKPASHTLPLNPVVHPIPLHPPSNEKVRYGCAQNQCMESRYGLYDTREKCESSCSNTFCKKYPLFPQCKK